MKASVQLVLACCALAAAEALQTEIIALAGQSAILKQKQLL